MISRPFEAETHRDKDGPRIRKLAKAPPSPEVEAFIEQKY